MQSYYKLVLTMLNISFVSECRLWKTCLTAVWHSFQANTFSKRSSTRQFWVYSGKRMLWRFSSSHGFWEKFNLAVARGSETQTKRKERDILLLRHYDYNEKPAFQHFSHCITALPRNHEVMRTFFTPKL